jgi:hypothetical protein
MNTLSLPQPKPLDILPKDYVYESDKALNKMFQLIKDMTELEYLDVSSHGIYLTLAGENYLDRFPKVGNLLFSYLRDHGYASLDEFNLDFMQKYSLTLEPKHHKPGTEPKPWNQ